MIVAAVVILAAGLLLVGLGVFWIIRYFSYAKGSDMVRLDGKMCADSKADSDKEGEYEFKYEGQMHKATFRQKKLAYLRVDYTKGQKVLVFYNKKTGASRMHFDIWFWKTYGIRWALAGVIIAALSISYITYTFK